MKKTIDKIIVIVTYFISSTSTFVLNKYIMVDLNFKSHYMLITIQSVLICLIIMGQVLTTNIKIKYSNAGKWYIASILLTGMMFTNMKAIFYMPLSIFTLYKNCSVIIVAFLELHFFKKKITLIGYISFILMIISSVLGNKKETFDFVGYIWMGSNIIVTSAYVIYLKKMMVVDSASKIESVFFTNLLSIPLLIILSKIFDTFEPVEINSYFVLGIVFSSVFAYLTSFTTSWAVKSLSSTTYTMIGALNKFLLSASGFFIFKEVADIRKILSLVVGISSGVVYSLDSIKKISRSQNVTTENVINKS